MLLVMGVVWSAPAECPAAAPAALAAIAPRVDVEIARHGRELVARIVLESDDDHEVRTLRAADCGELADAIALIVVHLARVRPVAPAPPPALRAQANADGEEPAARSSNEPRLIVAAPSPQWTIGASFAGVGGLGVLPVPAYGAEIAAYVEHGAASLTLARTQWSTREWPRDMMLLYREDFASTTARFGWRVAALPVRLRVNAELGGSGTGVGAFVGHEGPATWYAVGAGVAGAWQAAPWLRIVAASDLDLVVDRTRFALDDGTPVYEAERASMRISIAAETVVP